MGSWQAHAMSFLMRHTFKKKLAKSMGDIDKLRALMAAGKYSVPGNIAITADTVGDVPGEWVEARDKPAQATMLYLHGGGYFACSPKTHRPASCAFAAVGMRVFVPDYRLAPENPFPAAIEDARAVMAALVDQLGSTDQLLVAGDSAGGGLALAMMLTDRDAGLPLPAAAILFSPWTDMAVSGASVKQNERRCAMFTAGGIQHGAAMYLGGADPKDPLASPLYADLHGLPPLLIHASQAEVLRDDSVRLAARASEQGVVTSFRNWPAVPHVWQLFHQMIPEGRESLTEAVDFAFLHLKPAATASSAAEATTA